MPKFRKKPVVIEAIQFDGHNTRVILDWMDEVGKQTACGGASGMLIDTLEGIMEASINDWIIKGVNGEFYPCKPDIFEKTYEPVI